MTQRPQLPWKPLLAVGLYAVLAVVWAANEQPVEEAFGWGAWILTLPVASIVFGLVVGRWWAVGPACTR